jgi:oligogalacturonide lyase
MNGVFQILALLTAATSLGSCSREHLPVLETGAGRPMPRAWIDMDTGHKVTRLTGPGGDHRSFYFHNPPFIPASGAEGDLMVFYGSPVDQGDDKNFSARQNRQIFTLNLKTLETKQITHHPTPIQGEIVGKNRKEVFYQASDSVFSTQVETGETTLIYVFPDSIRGGITTLNAEEALLGGVYSDPEKYRVLREHPQKGDFFTRIFEARIPHTLFTLDIQSGIMEPIFSDTAWLNHVQFSPTDPQLLMFCHEGPWHLLDRIWTIRLDQREAHLMHRRTVYREIAGHEFFSPDGETIWFDLQIPRGESFYLAGLDLATGKEKRFALERDAWSIHFNVSPDLKLFAGDGGDSSQVAHAVDGQWIYLFTPEGDSLRPERLVNMKYHDYSTEPNVHFSPDGRQVIFRANFEGNTQVYAVETEAFHPKND